MHLIKVFMAGAGVLGLSAGLAALPAQAQQPSAQSQPDPKQAGQKEAEKPITQRDASAVDVVATPASDLNLRKGEIPQVLLDAEYEPYGLNGMARCSQIASAVQRLDAVLGDDFDIAQAPNRKLRPGKVAQSVVGSFIPFRGIIREISGANEQDRRLQSAIYAGTARRSFLRGVGLQRGCQWPARPATPQMLMKIAQAEADKADAKKEAQADRKAAGKPPRR